MKKSTKSSKPATPQVKAIAPVATKIPAAKKKTAAPKPAPVVAPKPAPAMKKAVAHKQLPAAVTPPAKAAPPAAPAPRVTTIVATIDVGFGNHLTVRGEGPGLSWEGGLALTPVADDRWSITLPGATAPVVFKVLVNDLTWSAGEDFVVPAGEEIILSPTF